MGSIRIEDLVSDPRVSEVAITNRSDERAQAVAVQFGATVVPWESIAETDADAAVVAVGTDAHELVLDAVLPRGIPVLCEKPIALTLTATQAAIDTATAHGSSLQIGFQRRFDAAIRSVHDTIESGRIGTMYSLTMTAHDHTPSAREFIAGSGGIFRDMLVHDFDLIRWLTGSEVETVAATKGVLAHHDYVDRFREAFRNETHSFVSFAAGEIANPCPPDSAVESLRIAIACEQSVATGSAVRVADVT